MKCSCLALTVKSLYYYNYHSFWGKATVWHNNCSNSTEAALIYVEFVMLLYCRWLRNTYSTNRDAAPLGYWIWMSCFGIVAWSVEAISTLPFILIYFEYLSSQYVFTVIQPLFTSKRACNHPNNGITAELLRKLITTDEIVDRMCSTCTKINQRVPGKKNSTESQLIPCLKFCWVAFFISFLIWTMISFCI